MGPATTLRSGASSCAGEVTRDSRDCDTEAKVPHHGKDNKAPLLLLVNLRATRVEPGLVAEVRAALRRRFEVEVVGTGGRGHAVSLCRQAGEFGAVAVLGGDGTINEAANGLVGGDVPLACLPGGLTNVFARALAGPLGAVAAAERLAAGGGRPCTVDVGSVAGRYFLFSSGLGLSATLTRRHELGPRDTPALAQVSATWAALRAVADEIGQQRRLRVTTPDGLVEGTTVVAQNAGPITFLGRHPLRVCREAGLTTRTLSLAVLRRAGPRELVTLAPRILSGRASAVASHPSIAALPAVTLARVETLDGIPLPLDADGEYLGEHMSVEYGVAPAALRVLA